LPNRRLDDVEERVNDMLSELRQRVAFDEQRIPILQQLPLPGNTLIPRRRLYDSLDGVFGWMQ
jgi:hypothetical protein